LKLTTDRGAIELESRHIAHLNAISEPAFALDIGRAEVCFTNAGLRSNFQLKEAIDIKFFDSKESDLGAIARSLKKDGFHFGKWILLVGNEHKVLDIHAFKVDENIGFVMIKESAAQGMASTTANALIFSCSKDGKLLAFNPVAERYFPSLVDEDWNGKEVLELFAPESRFSVQKLMNVTASGKGYYHTEAYFNTVKRDKEKLLVQGAALSGVNDAFLLVVHVIDVQLENALAEQESRADLAEELNEILKIEIKEHTETQRRLSSAERYANSIINSSVDIIISLNEHTQINEFNRTAQKITGYIKEEAVGKNFKDFLRIGEDCEEIFKTIEVDGLWEGKLTGWTKHKKILNLRVAISKLRSDDKQQGGYVCSMGDVTDTIEKENIAREQQAKIEAIFNSGSVMFWTVNKNTALTSFNEEYAKAIFNLYGQYPEINKNLNKAKKQFATDEYHDFWKQKYESVFESGKRQYFQTNTKESSGKENFREIILSPIIDSKSKEIKEVAGMGIDISEKKVTERRMNEQSTKIQAIFNASNHMIWSVDAKLNFTSCNESFEQRMLERFGRMPKLLSSSVDFANKCQAGMGTMWRKNYKQVLKGQKIQFEVLLVDILGKEHLEEVSLNPIYNQQGEVVEIAALSQTVTFKRTAERKLKEQAAKINAIFDSTAMLIWTVDTNLRVVAYNRIFGNQHFKLLGKEVSIGTKFSEDIISAISPDSSEKLINHFIKAFAGEQQQFEGVIHDQSGQKHWMETFLNPIYMETGEIKEISCLSYEITDKKEIQQQMLESIHEKEILLQEVHHRVKNNLQVISSILNLQSSYVKDQNSLSILRESQNRIKSMSFIHESLYHTGDFSKIEFSDYILSLTNSLIHSYSIGAGIIELITKFEKVSLVLDQAIPCGLIVNELISNALKYAFPEGKSGRITLEMSVKAGQLHLSIADDGIGLPKGLDVENSDTLGLQLVYTLADQLDANISVTSKKGTKYLITFEQH
jgi:PAS domain S-box-containing protein